MVFLEIPQRLPPDRLHAVALANHGTTIGAGVVWMDAFPFGERS